MRNVEPLYQISIFPPICITWFVDPRDMSFRMERFLVEFITSHAGETFYDVLLLAERTYDAWRQRHVCSRRRGCI